MAFKDGAGTGGGYITLNTTANTTAYNTSSDARLKTNYETFNALAIIKEMTPRQYERVCAPGVKEIGFIAQELYEVYPDAVSVGDADVEKRPWGVDYGRITPILVKAIQELARRLAGVETKTV
jgi:hypothetical protein